MPSNKHIKTITKKDNMIFYFTQKSTGHNDKRIEAVYPEWPKAYDSIPDQCYSICLPRNPTRGSAGDFQGLWKHNFFS
jgi:hypothetical protein